MRPEPAGMRPDRTTKSNRKEAALRAILVGLVGCALILAAVSSASAAVVSPSSRTTGGEGAVTGGKDENSLEAAAAKAGDTGRAVAMSLIGLAFAVAATVLAFKRDFKEAAGVFAVGIVSVLLATPAGVSLLRDTVGSLFGGQ
jgi:hypothetical protein